MKWKVLTKKFPSYAHATFRILHRYQRMQADGKVLYFLINDINKFILTSKIKTEGHLYVYYYSQIGDKIWHFQWQSKVSYSVVSINDNKIVKKLCSFFIKSKLITAHSICVFLPLSHSCKLVFFWFYRGHSGVSQQKFASCL